MLRVPLYLKMFEVLFFAAFLFFYYHVLVTKPVTSVSVAEVALYIWLAAFTHNGAYSAADLARSLTLSQRLESSGMLVSHSMQQTSGYVDTTGEDAAADIRSGIVGHTHHRRRRRILHYPDDRPHSWRSRNHRHSLRYPLRRGSLPSATVCTTLWLHRCRLMNLDCALS